MSEWISVAFRLPDYEKSVLTYGAYSPKPYAIKRIRVAQYFGTYWLGPEGTLEVVTHWMYLPAPPEVKQ